MSNSWDNTGYVVEEADMDSTDFEEDSNTEEEHSRGGRRPPAGRAVPRDQPHKATPLRNLARAAKPTPQVQEPSQSNNPANQKRNRDSLFLSRGMEGIQNWVVVILVVALCASLCHSLAFVSGSWMQNEQVHIGLWMDCNCTTYAPAGDLVKWLISSKVFLGIALVVAVGTAFTIPVYTALEAAGKKKTLAEILYRCSDGTLVLTLVGCMPAGLLFDIDNNLGVGFSLCVVAALLCLPRHVLLTIRDQDTFLYKFNWAHATITLCYLITVHFLLVCYVTSVWASNGNNHVGLWMNCTCGGSTFKDDNTFKAVQAMITVSEILLLINVFIIAVLSGLPVTNTKRTLLITSIHIICFAAGITTVIADVMFATNIVEGYAVDYSFIFSILSAVFCIIASVIAVLRRSSARSQANPMSAA